MPLPRIPRRGATGETARLIQSQFNVTTPPGIVIKQSPTGTEWRDDRQRPFPAEITGDGLSSSSDNSSSSDTFDRYDWAEVVPLIDGTFVQKEDGRSGTSDARYAKEANGDPSVPIGAIVEMYPGPGEPDWYYFFYAADASSDQQFSFEIDCDNGTITVGDPPTTSSKISSSGGGTGVTPKPNGGGGPGVVDNTGNGGLP